MTGDGARRWICVCTFAVRGLDLCRIACVASQGSGSIVEGRRLRGGGKGGELAGSRRRASGWMRDHGRMTRDRSPCSYTYVHGHAVCWMIIPWVSRVVGFCNDTRHFDGRCCIYRCLICCCRKRYIRLEESARALPKARREMRKENDWKWKNQTLETSVNK